MSKFPSTRWTQIVKIARDPSGGGRPALAELCERYWPPLYAYARRDGRTVEQAKDLTQGFFARFLEKESFRAADPARGRFRSFLLTSFKHFIWNEWAREQAVKRGGGQHTLDFDTAETSYRLEPADTLTPEALFELRWALELFDRVLSLLAAEQAQKGADHKKVFEQLKGFLRGGDDERKYVEVARALGITEIAARTRVNRLQNRFDQILEAEIAALVSDDSDVEDEIRYIKHLLSR